MKEVSCRGVRCLYLEGRVAGARARLTRRRLNGGEVGRFRWDATTGSPRRMDASADTETMNSRRGRTALVACGGIYVDGRDAVEWVPGGVYQNSKHGRCPTTQPGITWSM